MIELRPIVDENGFAVLIKKLQVRLVVMTVSMFVGACPSRRMRR
jgi:hypothetical protein